MVGSGRSEPIHSTITDATNEGDGGIKGGTFLVARFDEQEWRHVSEFDRAPLLRGRGGAPDHVLVVDPQTGEGAIFGPGGVAPADLNKDRIWGCPLSSRSSLGSTRSLDDLGSLQRLVRLQAPSAY